jgi:hypothetical protein
VSHRTFIPPRTVREYGYMDGELVEDLASPSGFLLPWEAIDDQAQAIATRRAPSFVVVGEFVRDDGTRFPELGVTTAHIEETTNYRWDRNTKTLRLLCPGCGLKDGKHLKGCESA